MSKPPKLTHPDRYEVRLSPEIRGALDDWRRAQPDLPSRADAIRRLALRGLDAEAEIARLRALLAAAGVDADATKGDAT